MSAALRKILIANRGEIAVRIGRTCRDLGIETVAVYSEADRNALHVRLSHEAWPIGGPTPADSYLRGDRILAVALESGADAIHPGYGFLSENAAFARVVTEAGLAFIGPPPEAMEVMGDKIRSRQAMQAAGVPVVPGTTEPLETVEAARRTAAEIGYPVMIKASAGGGGKGIRIVRESGEMDAAFRTASGEAESAFGDGRLYMEKFVDQPRHIEVQVLGDAHGHVIALGERECSVQRRHQKLIEEAPSACLSAEQRKQMEETAVRAAQAIGYYSAGTVEFLWSQGDFYFLEMNTRLQVEHGVTEEIFGLDLVEQMIRVAAGEKLNLPDELDFRGHAIEIRINAEDPEQNFAPSLGVIRNLRLPGGPGVRIDTAAFRGMEVTPFYDSLLMKLIVYGATRELARQRAIRALQELHIGNVATGAGLGLEVLRSPEFTRGEYDTGFLDHFETGGHSHELEEVAAVVAALHRVRSGARRSLQSGTDSQATRESNWVRLGRRQAMGGSLLKHWRL